MKQGYRHLIQLAFAAICNGFTRGLKTGTIFQGKTKYFCVPVLNCYSCPGALGSCPIGSLQAVLGDRNHHFPFYVLGLLMLFGILLGRLICGFLCLFGFIQDLLFKIPTPKLKIKKSLDRKMRCFKYVVLITVVIIAPLALTNSFGIGSPYFCKWICPVGTLEGGIPLVLSNPALQNTIGNIFFWKISILVMIVVSSIFIYRPFCKYLCPLGACYALLNRFSFYQVKIDHNRCIGCKACESICKMQVRLTENKDIGECIRCGECKNACPANAIYVEYCGKTPKPLKTMN